MNNSSDKQINADIGFSDVSLINLTPIPQNNYSKLSPRWQLNPVTLIHLLLAQNSVYSEFKNHRQHRPTCHRKDN
jgi:hypothetical protein